MTLMLNRVSYVHFVLLTLGVSLIVKLMHTFRKSEFLQYPKQI